MRTPERTDSGITLHREGSQTVEHSVGIGSEVVMGSLGQSIGCGEVRSVLMAVG